MEFFLKKMISFEERKIAEKLVQLENETFVTKAAK